MATQTRSPLQNLKVANPCPASWSEMQGDERVRYCGECKLNVYNLSDMSRAEAEDLLRNTEGRLCVRYFQRTDGLVMTRDCPKGMFIARTKLARAILITAGLVVTGFGYAIQREMKNSEEQTWVDQAVDKGRSVPALQPLIDKICPPPTTGKMVVGRMVMRRPPPAVPTPPKKP